MRTDGNLKVPGRYHQPIRRSMSGMLVCLAFLLFTSTSPVCGEEIDRLIAAVNRNVITEGDLQLANAMNAIISNDSKPFPRSRSESIKRLIDLELMRQELNNFSLSSEDESRIEERIRSLHQANSASGSLENLLSRLGLHESELRSYLQLESSILKFVDFRFRPFASVSDEEIRRYYEERLTLQLQKAKLEIPPLTEVSAKIEEILREEKINTALEHWIEDIRRNSHIESFEEESRLLGSD
jgi:hypothetical protein